MATIDSVVPLKRVKRVQFGILSPEEIVSCNLNLFSLPGSSDLIPTRDFSLNL